MKIIQQGSELILGLTSPDKVKGKIKPSLFNFEKEILGLHILFNTLTREIISLDDKEYGRYLSTDCYDPSEDMIKKLIAKGFFVSADTDEIKRYKEILNIYRTIWKNANNKLVQYKIFTTTYCNARCFYCFEEGLSYNHMSTETAENVVQYILKTCTSEKITLYWFGGEPLCNVSAIDYICNRLSEEKIKYVSKIITNGYLFDDDLVEKSVNLWKLYFAQITLDGTEEEHNRRKAYINPKESPFKRTVANIKRLLNAGVFVSVRLNFDEGNINQIRDLVDMLYVEFKDYEKFRVYPAILSNDWLNHKEERLSETDELLGNEFFNIYRLLLKYNLHKPAKISNAIKPYFCMAANPACATISSKGELYTCQSCDDNMRFGTVTDGVIKSDIVDKWENCTDTFNKCRDCKFLPECSAFDKCPTQNFNCKKDKDFLITEQLKSLLSSDRQNAAISAFSEDEFE